MATLHVHRDDERQRVVAIEIAEARLDSSRHARPVAIAAIEDLAVKQDDRLAQAVGINVGHECVELFPFDQWEDARDGVEFD